MAVQSESDDAIIERFLAGEPAAVAEVDGWLARAASAYRRRLGDQFEDALQDVRLEVTRLLQDGKFRGDSSLKTYLWRVAAHTCLDRLRSGSRWSFVEYDGETAESAVAERAGQAPARASYTELDLLLRVLARMEEECRRLWSMLIEGRSYREMSDETGVSEGALRVRVLRCRRRAQEVRDELLARRPVIA